MELVKNNLRMNDIALNTATKLYINEEVVVSEVYQPIENVIKETAGAVATDLKIRENQVSLEGNLDYAVLYNAEDSGMVQGLQGQIPIEEQIRVPDITEENEVSARIVIDNISVKKLNSRKILLKAEMTVYLTVEKVRDEEFPTSVMDENEISVRNEKIEPLAMVVNKKDTFRIRDEVPIPQNQSSIYKILWKDVKIKNVAIRLMDRMIHIGGELCVFFLYMPDDDNMPGQWVETNLSFGGTLDIQEAAEDMIAYVDVDLQDVRVEPIENEMGDSREAKVDVLLGLNIKIYEEKTMDIITDIYSPYYTVVPISRKSHYNKLLIKNSSRSKNVIKVKADQNKGNILQICNSMADLKIENTTVDSKGLTIEGKIGANVIYVSSDDKEPLCVVSKEEKFSHTIDVPDMSKSNDYYLNWRVEPATSNMVSADEIETKVSVVMELIVFEKCFVNIISDVTTEEIDAEKIAAQPTVKGHIVQSGETLWELAKNNFTTIEKIMALNDLKSSQIKPGDRLLIAKAVKR